MTHATRRLFLLLASMPVILGLLAGCEQADNNAAVTADDNTQGIVNGKQVSFNYTLNADGELVESNVDAEPLIYVQGSGQVLEALENAMAGMQVGDQKAIVLTAAEGYGEIRAEAVREVPVDQVPEEMRQIGALLQAPEMQGPIRVIEIRDDVIVLNGNHPLAGKSLTFDVTIVAIETPAPVVN